MLTLACELSPCRRTTQASPFHRPRALLFDSASWKIGCNYMQEPFHAPVCCMGTTVLEDEAVFPASNWDDAVQVKCTGTVQTTLHCVIVADKIINDIGRWWSALGMWRRPASAVKGHGIIDKLLSIGQPAPWPRQIWASHLHRGA